MSNSINIGKQILAGVKGRVRSNSIYIENLKLVGSVQSLKPRPKCQIQSLKENRSLQGSKVDSRPIHPPPGFSNSLARLPMCPRGREELFRG